jgi:hypothetical protein
MGKPTRRGCKNIGVGSDERALRKTALKQLLHCIRDLGDRSVFFRGRHDKTEDASMKRLFLAAVISSFVVVGAASINAASNLSGRLIPGIEPITEQQIRDKLTADGFSNIQVTSQGSIFQTKATKDGRALGLAIDAESGAVLQVRDDDDDD